MAGSLEESLVEFQKQHMLDSDGNFGPSTQKKLNEATGVKKSMVVLRSGGRIVTYAVHPAGYIIKYNHHTGSAIVWEEKSMTVHVAEEI